MGKIVSFAERRATRAHVLMRAGLPPAKTTRWVASRKAAVVEAVDAGAISEAEVCALYGLSGEELNLWRAAFARHGAPALLVTKLQHFRNT
ncbi:MAG: DUF1153 domain-containing protein [Pikeienuella sp.]